MELRKNEFVDLEERRYRIKITFPVLREIRDELDIDLGQPGHYIELSKDLINVVNVLYLLVREQATAYELTDVQFGESLDGKVLEKGWLAFQEAYLDFVPSHQEKALRRLVAMSERTELLSLDETERRIEELIASYGSDSNGEESSDSIPIGTH